jgi:2-polyprenyl-3-methyl-5-hydroxy-6-metoxy-1,4-benzoquinol methylase
MKNLLSRWLQERRFRAALPHIRGRVLDFGCGHGWLSRRVGGQGYTGVDHSERALRRARKLHPDKRFVSVEELASLGRESFDAVVLLAVIEHLPDPAATLRSLRQFLAPEGRVVLTTPEPRLEWAHGLGAGLGLFSRHAHGEHQSLMDRAGIEAAAAAAGLSVETYRRFLWGANQLAVLRQGR